jgi:NitT/TauT family transport system substrate-binding protein
MSPKRISRKHFIWVGGSLLAATALSACGDNTATSAPASTTQAAAATTAAGLATTAASSTTTAATAATTAASSATTAAAATGSLKKIKYALPTAPILSYSEAYIAKEGGFWQKEGLDVELVSGSGTASSLQQVSTKTAFAARGGAITTIINRANQNVPIRSVYAVYRGIQFIIITNDAKGIKTPADMKGKTIGVVSRGGSTEQLLSLLLAQASIKPDQVQLQVTGANTGGYAFLDSGKVDAFVTTNHVGVELNYNKTPIKIISISDFLKFPSDDVIIHQDTVKDDPDTVQKLLRGLQNARKWAQQPENLDTAIKYCSVYTPDETKNAELAKLKVSDDIKRWTEGSSLKLGQIDKAGWTSLQDALATNNFIQKKLDLSELIDTSFIDKVEPA